MLADVLEEEVVVVPGRTEAQIHSSVSVAPSAGCGFK
jgi:hypothetical protein